LEDLDELKLSPTFDLESFQLRQRPVVVEHGITFLEQFVFLLRRGKYHSSIRPVELEEDGILAMDAYSPVSGLRSWY
jgi:hypothetical protein